MNYCSYILYPIRLVDTNIEYTSFDFVILSFVIPSLYYALVYKLYV